jgi:hypothetical protein
MQDISSVSSEEELLQLRNEGKISEQEYEQLRGAMQKSAEVETIASLPENDEKKSKRRLGKIAFRLMLLGIIVPIVAYACFWVFEFRAFTPEGGTKITAPITERPGSEITVTSSPSSHFRSGLGWPSFLLALILEIAAFVMGVIAWPDVFAKATVVTISSMVVLVFLFLIAVIVFPL